MNWPFDPKAELIIVETKLYGPQGDFIVKLALDTGATLSLVSFHVITALGYKVSDADETIEITTGSGVEYVPRIRVARVATLGKIRRSFPVLCHTLPPSATVDGLLGLDFLQKRCLMIDFRKGLISLD
jgi:predicted aspartyl protease